MYICECGKEFNFANSFNTHKSHCKTHFFNKYGNLDLYFKRKETLVNIAKENGKKLVELSAQKKKNALDKWISEQHKCEKCGKIMTKKFGSGRFCSRACANSRGIKKVKPEKLIKSLKEPIYVNCSYCGKLIEITHKKQNKTGRYYCDGTCRNKHLNKLKEIGGINQGLNISKWELDLQDLLTKYNIKFEANKRDLIPSGLEIDIWLPELKTAIELNGVWHYSEVPYHGHLDQFEKRKQKDQLKEKEIKELNYKYYVFEDRNIKDTISFFTDFIENTLLK